MPLHGRTPCPNRRRLAEHSWSQENLRFVVEPPQKPRSTATDDPAGLPVLPPEPEVQEHEDEEPAVKPEDDDHDMQGELLEEPDTATTPGTKSSSRGEKRTQAQESVFVKKRLTTKSPKRPAAPADDPVKRTLTKKTDTKDDDLVMDVDANQVTTINSLQRRDRAREESLRRFRATENLDGQRRCQRSDEGTPEGS